VTPQLARLAALGGFRGWERMVRRYITDERLLRVFTFQALYAGVPPQSALAAYAVIAYMDTVAGVYFPQGGVRAMPDAMAASAADAGVEFIYNATVSELEFSGSRVTGVRTADGGRVPADAVVLTTELPDTYRLVRRTPRRPLKLRAAPSAVVAHVGCEAVGEAAGHHTILFGDAWHQTFRDIIDDGRTMRDPSLLVTRPTASDPSLAPAGRDLLYVLAPAPNTDVGVVDWDTAGPAYVEQMLDDVRKRAPGVGEDAEVLHVVTPADWGRQGMAAGSPFALAHTFSQTGPFRPANTVRGVDNVVLAGSSTVPGVGVPTAILSGRLAADRITGVHASQPTSEVNRS
jgi:phytoene desaturase